MKVDIPRRETVVELALQGHPPREIERETGLSRQTIYSDLKAARRAGQQIPRFETRGVPRARPEPSERHRKVVDMALEGTPPRVIADRLELAPEAVHYELRNARKQGVEIPPFRCGRSPKEFRTLRIAPEAMRPLVAHADLRRIPTVKLAERLLECIAADDLVDAVLDDGAADG